MYIVLVFVSDDLLEDGDLSETNFEELDLAEEDALLADDGDDFVSEIILKLTWNIFNSYLIFI